MNRKTYTVKSPAKINIGLYVLNKRSDGYHNIETIFYPIKAYDELKINIAKIDSPENKITVQTNPQAGINGKNNICYQAVNLFLNIFKIREKYRVEVNIKKKIPIGAGLGGGSSNAAAVLKVLSKYFKKENNTLKIKNIALKLGSDVPFFLLGKPAYATSRGEKLTVLPKFKVNYHILIVNPNIHVSTKWAYNELNIKYQKTKSKKSKEIKLRKIENFKVTEADSFQNDFEEVVFKKFPAIKRIKDGMYKKGAVFSLMSGSGSSVFGFFDKNINRIPGKL